MWQLFNLWYYNIEKNYIRIYEIDIIGVVVDEMDLLGKDNK